MIEFDLEVNNRQIAAYFDQLRDHLTTMGPVMQRIGEVMLHSTQKRFISGQGPDGTSWAPKSDATIAAYLARKETVDFRPLFGPSGDLSSQIYYQVAADGNSVAIGSSMIYAAVQQFGAKKGAFGATARGGKIPWGDIPARPFLGLSSGDEDNLRTLLVWWLDRATAANQKD